MTRLVETLGERIKRCRQAAKLTQQELGDKAGTSAAAVAQWETGDTKAIKAEYIFKVARALGKSAEWLVTGEGPESPPVLDEIVNALPDDDPQQVLDFIEFRFERAEGLVASEKIARYTAMIEDFKRDLDQRRKSAPKPPRGGKTT